MSKADLKLDWCSYEAAKYAVEHWHYSGSVTTGHKWVSIGVWENATYIGCLIFGDGPPQGAKQYGLKREEVCELARVALRDHRTPVTRIVRIALIFLKQRCPGIQLVISYADPEQQHVGIIYQAGNWLYVGPTKPCEHFVDNCGRRIHSKTLRTGHRGLATELKKTGRLVSVKTWKHKYLMPFDPVLQAQLEPLRKPYPKRVRSADSGTPDDQSGGDSAILIRTLSDHQARLERAE